MFIIIEGPTAAGKSTLIERLQTQLDNPDFIHMGQPAELNRRWALKEYVNKWQRRKPNGGDLLADRWHWGEATYAPLYRPDTNQDGFGLLGRAGWRWTELFLASRGACVAYLTANNKTLAERLATRGDDHVKKVDDLLRVRSLYEVVRRESINVAAIHDTSSEETSDEKYEHFVNSLVQEAQRREALAQKVVARYPRYVGPVTPDVLLVGDHRNVTKKYGNETILPFMPVDGNSAEFLLNSFNDQAWRGVGMINGHEVKRIDLLLRRLGNPAVVALGKEAESALDEQGIKAPKVPHPQYVRRFHSKQQKEYGQLIMQAAQTGEVDHDWKL